MDVREKLVELLKKTPVANINGHTAEAEVCFLPRIFECFANYLISHGVTVQEWIPVKDRLPDMNEEVFAVYKNSLFENGPKFTKVLHREGKHWVDKNGYRYLYENITHWMPLPPAPEDAK